MDASVDGSLDNSVGARFAPWRIVRLGVIQSVAEYRRALKRAKFNLDDDASHMLESPRLEISKEVAELKLVCVFVDDLGLVQGAHYKEVCEKARHLGLERCPAEVALALRLSYTDQPLSSRIFIAMNPINGKLFGVE